MLPVQPGTRHSPVSSEAQCLLNQHVLYLPLPILAWTEAFFISNGEFEHDVHMGEGEQRDMCEVRNSDSEGREAECSLSFFVQKLTTLSFVSFFHSFLWGGLARTYNGSGSWY